MRFASRSILRALIAISASVSFAVLPAQVNVPVREVARPSVASSEVFANIFTVRETSGGRVLVNDALRRQIVLLDANLSHATVVLDSLPGARSYGPVASPLLRWFGDSSLFLDQPSRTLLVLDAAGNVVRAMAPPKQGDVARLWANESGLDPAGNLLYRASAMKLDDPVSLPNGATVTRQRQADSAAIVRAIFETRTVDTVGHVKQDSTTVTTRTSTLDGKQSLNIRLNPLTPIDEWTTLSDGTLAFVRGHDYHVDYLRPNGAWQSTGKLPFDWKPLSDADKQNLVDSTRRKIERARELAEQTGGKAAGDEAVLNYLRGAVATSSRPVTPTPPSATPAPPSPELSYDFAPLGEIANYYPPIRVGGAKADLEGNLWLLPTTSAQSKHGELVYDVVNPARPGVFRVRMPPGRSIAGFGRNGALYLMSRESDGWHLERAVLNVR